VIHAPARAWARAVVVRPLGCVSSITVTDVATCEFPDCPLAQDGGDLPFCAEHRALLLDDPGEFRRRWGAIDPRPGAVRQFLPRHHGGTATMGPDDG
jgi:hypothetical protein